MSESAPTVPPAAVLVTRAELFWLTAGAWLSGSCLLALLPVLLAPRLGPFPALAVTYLLFFTAWQPIKQLTERAIGPQKTVIRMLAFMASAAMLAYYVREALLALVAGTLPPAGA